MLELDLLCEAQILEGLTAHEQAGILCNGVANCLGHEGHRPGCSRIGLNDVDLHMAAMFRRAQAGIAGLIHRVCCQAHAAKAGTAPLCSLLGNIKQVQPPEQWTPTSIRECQFLRCRQLTPGFTLLS